MTTPKTVAVGVALTAAAIALAPTAAAGMLAGAVDSTFDAGCGGPPVGR